MFYISPLNYSLPSLNSQSSSATADEDNGGRNISLHKAGVHHEYNSTKPWQDIFDGGPYFLILLLWLSIKYLDKSMGYL
jgi:hypothetical protein